MCFCFIPSGTLPTPAAVATAISDVETGWIGPSCFPRTLRPTPYVIDTVNPATPLLELRPNHEVIALIHSFGSGSVVLLLGLNASSALADVSSGGLGVVSHLLSRISNDTSPIVVNCNGCRADGTGLQVLTSRSPGGWNVTLINDLGITKEPATPVVVDTSKTINTTIGIRMGFGNLIAAWKTTDAQFALLPMNEGSVPVEIAPGDVVTLGLDVEW